MHGPLNVKFKKGAITSLFVITRYCILSEILTDGGVKYVDTTFYITFSLLSQMLLVILP